MNFDYLLNAEIAKSWIFSKEGLRSKLELIYNGSDAHRKKIIYVKVA